MLYTGIGLENLPQELGFGSGMTCWRRLRDWQQAGVFDRLHEVLLAELNAATVIDWSRACVDASHVRAKGGPRHGRARSISTDIPSPADQKSLKRAEIHAGCALGRTAKSSAAERRA